jgi:hypothetical protein
LPTGPATAAGFPLITASDAASVLTSGHSANPSPATRLTVTGVKLGTAVFGTDRGRQATPLGNRVLVDATTFAPIPVTQSLVSSS